MNWEGKNLDISYLVQEILDKHNEELTDILGLAKENNIAIEISPKSLMPQVWRPLRE